MLGYRNKLICHFYTLCALTTLFIYSYLIITVSANRRNKNRYGASNLEFLVVGFITAFSRVSRA